MTVASTDTTAVPGLGNSHAAVVRGAVVGHFRGIALGAVGAGDEHQTLRVSQDTSIVGVSGLGAIIGGAGSLVVNEGPIRGGQARLAMGGTLETANTWPTLLGSGMIEGGWAELTVGSLVSAALAVARQQAGPPVEAVVDDGLRPIELKARSIALPAVALDAPGADANAAVAAMKAGAVDYLTVADEASLRAALANARVKSLSEVRPMTRDETAGARLARLTPREREVLLGLVDGGTNKSIGQKLGISPRTVELHRAQVMHRLNAASLMELLQTALDAGMAPSAGVAGRS